MIQNSKSVILNKKAANILGEKDLEISKQLLENLKETRDKSTNKMDLKKKNFHYASQLQVNNFHLRVFYDNGHLKKGPKRKL